MQHDQLGNQTERLFAQAKDCLARGQLDAAEAVLQNLLRQDPGHAEANAFLAGRAIQRADWTEAAVFLETALLAQPRSVGLHQQLARVQDQLMAGADAPASWARVLARQPLASSSRLHYADALRDAGQPALAVRHARQALRCARQSGFWVNEASTPPWLRGSVNYWREQGDRHLRACGENWLTALGQAFSAQDIPRVVACIEDYVGLKPAPREDPRQQPTQLFIPGLPATPVFAARQLPSAQQFHDALPGVLAELQQVAANDKAFVPFFADLAPAEQASMVAGASWDAFFFFRHGKRFDDAHARCPVTSGLLAGLPLAHVERHGPECLFSVLRPGAHILPHRGVTNARAVLHCGLVTPPDCALNVCEIAQLQWQPGQLFAFDDTYLHEAWNRGAEPRVVLLMDIWNPYLHEAERAALAMLIPWIGAYEDESLIALSQ